MKSARERAGEIFNAIGLPVEERLRCERKVIRIIREAMRDQRHLCAEAVLGIGDGYAPAEYADPEVLANRAHAVAMNAPEPGDAPGSPQENTQRRP